LAQSGNGISTFGISDIFLNIKYKASEKTNLILGAKIPLTNANKSQNQLTLPMDYQASLGTFDLILGMGYRFKKIQWVIAIQQPLTQNNNTFNSEEYPENSNLKFMSLNNYGVLKSKVLINEGEFVSKKHRKHYSLITLGISKRIEVDINIQSDRNQPNIKILCIENYKNPLLKKFDDLVQGYTPVASVAGGLALDFLRQELFPKADLFDSHPIDGDTICQKLNNYLCDHEHIVVYGSLYRNEKENENNSDSKKITPNIPLKNGMDNVHMNQGNQGSHLSSNGIYQDGALFIKNKKSYTAIFFCFAEQCDKTDDTGYCLP